MSAEEKSTWIMGAVAVAAYATYVAVILGMADGGPLTEVAYVAPLLWAIGAAIVANIVINIAVGIASPKDAGKKDQRDKQIYRIGEYRGQVFVIAGAIAALLMALLEFDHFWIANVIYLCFVLSAILSSVIKIVSYRRGLPAW
jgi:hypothetical protein